MHSFGLPRHLFTLLLGGLAATANAAPLEPGPDEALLYYQRDDGTYEGWGLHLWNTPQCTGVRDGTSWEQPLAAAGVDAEYGAWYRILLTADASCLNLIMHRGNDKDLGGGDLTWRFDELGRRVFSLSGSAQLSATPIGATPLVIDGARAHWLDPQTLVLHGGSDAARLELRYSAQADIQIDGLEGQIVNASWRAPVDGGRRTAQCRVDGDLVTWKPGDASTPEQNRWMNQSGDPVARFVLDGDAITINTTLPDGSTAAETYSVAAEQEAR